MNKVYQKRMMLLRTNKHDVSTLIPMLKNYTSVPAPETVYPKSHLNFKDSQNDVLQ